MKQCIMCGTEKEDVSVVQVAPATWNGFNHYSEVCAECQSSRKFKVWSRSRTSKAKTEAAAAADAEAVPAGKAAVTTQIAHRRTGALLHTVEGGSLAGASLGAATLNGADLQHAALRGADMQRADLRLADLSGADLRGADLRGANFRGADLRGADLREARLQRSDLMSALYDERTRWPEGFDANASGARKESRRS